MAFDPAKYLQVRLPQLLKAGLDPMAALYLTKLESNQGAPCPIRGLEDLGREPKLEGRVVILARNGLRLTFREGRWHI